MTKYKEWRSDRVNQPQGLLPVSPVAYQRMRLKTKVVFCPGDQPNQLSREKYRWYQYNNFEMSIKVPKMYSLNLAPIHRSFTISTTICSKKCIGYLFSPCKQIMKHGRRPAVEMCRGNSSTCMLFSRLQIALGNVCFVN